MDFDGPDGYDPEKMIDKESENAMMEKQFQFQIEAAGKNKPYMEKLRSLIQEAAEKNII